MMLLACRPVRANIGKQQVASSVNSGFSIHRELAGVVHTNFRDGTLSTFRRISDRVCQAPAATKGVINIAPQRHDSPPQVRNQGQPNTAPVIPMVVVQSGLHVLPIQLSPSVSGVRNRLVALLQRGHAKVDFVSEMQESVRIAQLPLCTVFVPIFRFIRPLDDERGQPHKQGHDRSKRLKPSSTVIDSRSHEVIKSEHERNRTRDVQGHVALDLGHSLFLSLHLETPLGYLASDRYCHAGGRLHCNEAVLP